MPKTVNLGPDRSGSKLQTLSLRGAVTALLERFGYGA